MVNNAAMGVCTIYTDDDNANKPRGFVYMPTDGYKICSGHATAKWEYFNVHIWN